MSYVFCYELLPRVESAPIKGGAQRRVAIVLTFFLSLGLGLSLGAGHCAVWC